MSHASFRLRSIFNSIIKAQVERPWAIATIAIVTTIAALLAALSLRLKTDLSELLPDNKPSVVEMRRVGRRLATASTLTLVVEVPRPNPQALETFADEVAPRIRALGSDWVGTVDAGHREAYAFVDSHKFLYAPLDDIRKVHDDARERYLYEVQKAAGGDLGLDEGPPPFSVESIRKRLGDAAGSTATKSGYYLGDSGKLLAILIRTPVEPGSIESAHRLRAKIDEVVASTHATNLDPGMAVHYTGDFITSVEEYESVKEDLGHVGLCGVLMVLGAVVLFFLRVRTLIAMGLTIGIGITWTFGAARLTVGYLNSSTGFLVSIIAGNGINFGIIYMARYLEARRTEGKSPDEAVLVAHRETWLATLAAAGAAMISYGSLAITDFRGFKHFGIIGGAGMILCWLATYAFLPTILVVSERASPMFPHRSPTSSKLQGFYGYGFAWLAERFPRAITIVGVIVGVVSMGMAVHYFAAEPLEYDMTKLRNDHRGGPSEASELSQRVDQIVGRMGQDGMAIMVDRLDQVMPVKTELERRRTVAPADAKPFEQVVTIFDLLPQDQPEKLPLLNETRNLLLRARAHGMLPEHAWADLAVYVPSVPFKALGVDDLPDEMARAFTEKDGTRGRIVYITPKEGRSISDGRYLEQWADSFRTITLPNGEVIRGSGRAVIYADTLKAVVEDAPKAMIISLAGTWLVVLAAFRGGRASWAVLATLMLGVAAMVAFLALKQLKLNFLSFVTLPITFGIGVDYAVNVMQRLRLCGRENIHRVIIETGGAVVLCSMTTTLGYLSLMLSVNRAIVTFGITAAAGEVACILAAVLVMPAALIWTTRTLDEQKAVRGRS